MQTLSVASSSAMSVRVVTVRASLDTQQRLSYNRNAPRKIPKPESPSTATGTAKTPPTVTLTATTTSVFDLLKRPAQGIPFTNSFCVLVLFWVCLTLPIFWVLCFWVAEKVEDNMRKR